MTNSNKLQELPSLTALMESVEKIVIDAMGIYSDFGIEKEDAQPFVDKLHQVILETAEVVGNTLIGDNEIFWPDMKEDSVRVVNELKAQQRARLSQLMDSLKDEK